MNSNSGVIVQLLRNRNNNMYYKAVANSLLFMWSPRAKAWIKPCTTYLELMDSIENYELINDRDAAHFAKVKFK